MFFTRLKRKEKKKIVRKKKESSVQIEYNEPKKEIYIRKANCHNVSFQHLFSDIEQ